MKMNQLTPAQARESIEKGRINGQTAGMCPGYAQGNIVILSENDAIDFRRYAENNPKPCPILEIFKTGDPISHVVAKGADITKVVPRYRIFHNGEFVDEVDDITSLWQEDFVTFVLGCSFTFESALIDAGIRMKHIEMNKNVAMYVTAIQTKPAGRFSGPMVVSMRPIKNDEIEKVIQITSLYPEVHGAPIHIGDPMAIGIMDVENPDFGEFVPIESDETPVFWACGVTPQMALKNAGAEIAITHSPGHMLITDLKNTELGGL